MHTPLRTACSLNGLKLQKCFGQQMHEIRGLSAACMIWKCKRDGLYYRAFSYENMISSFQRKKTYGCNVRAVMKESSWKYADRLSESVTG